MDFLSQRQSIIAQNVANADTPGYRPRDLEEQDFGKILGDISGGRSGIQKVSMASSSADHIGGSSMDPAKARKQKEVYEATLSGNSVVIEEQLVKSNKNTMDYNLMSNLYQKNVGLIRSALGTGR